MIKNNIKSVVGISLFITLCFLSACNNKSNNAPTFFASDNPNNLSDWGLLKVSNNKLLVSKQANVYDLKTALFSDYAHKLRTIWMPDGQVASKNLDGSYDFPVGTVISKTFYYPKADSKTVQLISQSSSTGTEILLKTHKLMETRLLVKREAAWVGLPYIWNAEQTDATLQRFGELIKLTGELENGAIKSFNYLVPDVNQCAGCHQWNKDKGLQPIGLQARHLIDAPQFNGHVIALDEMSSMRTTAEPNTTIEIENQARRYLDINCSHCHNPQGPGNTSGLNLEAFRELSSEVGLCKLPIAAGAGTGDREFDIQPGHPDQSIISYRMNSDKPDIMMPELGRSLIHHEGVELIDNWITGLTGNCGLKL